MVLLHAYAVNLDEPHRSGGVGHIDEGAIGVHVLVAQVRRERVHQMHITYGLVVLLSVLESFSERLVKPEAKRASRPYRQQVRIDPFLCLNEWVPAASVQSEHRRELDAEAREVRDVRAIVCTRGAQHVLRLSLQRAHVGVECVPVEQLLAGIIEIAHTRSL